MTTESLSLIQMLILKVQLGFCYFIVVEKHVSLSQNTNITTEVVKSYTFSFIKAEALMQQ